MTKFNVLISSLLIVVASCSPSEENVVEPSLETSNYQTENVVIVVIDGPRIIDTWAKEGAIPHQKELANEGVLFNNFFNDGETYTLSGHTAITTGSYEKVNNDGSEFPAPPSIFQLFLAEKQLPPQSSALITSKSKLHAIANSKDLSWKDSYLPYMNTEDRYDSLTVKVALDYLAKNQPVLSLIHFRGPDKYGHRADWSGYLQSIAYTDRYVSDIWSFIQNNNYYRNKTTLLVTNDHGRHLDEIGTGFKGHGDLCEGCRHISLLALGPDLTKNQIVEKTYGQTDIAPTIAKILNFKWHGEGEEIKELTNTK